MHTGVVQTRTVEFVCIQARRKSTWLKLWWRAEGNKVQMLLIDTLETTSIGGPCVGRACSLDAPHNLVR